MTQTRDLIKKMADFFTGEEFYEKGEDARLELSSDDVRCMNEVIKACGNAISRQAVLDLVDSYSESQSNVEDVTQDMISDILALLPVNPQNCDKCEVGNPCLYCKHEFESQKSEDLGDYPDTIHNQFDNMTGSMNL